MIDKEDLLKRLRLIVASPYRTADDHEVADDLLLEYIADVEITEAYNRIPKCYH